MNWTSYVNGFESYLMLERALSENSVEAYIRDVNKLVEFLKIKEYEVSPTEITLNHLEEFIMWINELGLGARSQARIISGLKAFYKYLLVEDLLDTAPTELLEGPRLERKIPDVLLSGDHAAVERWRREQSEETTKKRRPDLWEKHREGQKE